MIKRYKTKLMCNNCFHLVNQNIYFSSLLKRGEPIDQGLSLSLTSICPKCHKKVLFETIDIGVAKIVQLLNKKGYYTEFSCDGHFNIVKSKKSGSRYNYNYPYISFYNDVKTEFPKWFLDDICSNGFILRKSFTDAIYIDMERIINILGMLPRAEKISIDEKNYRLKLANAYINQAWHYLKNTIKKLPNKKIHKK